METLYSEINLCVLDPKDVQDAVRILMGEVSLVKAADARGQNTHFFGDGDVLILTCSRDTGNGAKHMRQDFTAMTPMNPNVIFANQIIPAIAKSRVRLELVVRNCKLSMETIISLSDAIRMNTGLIGFSVTGNPGDENEIGALALKYACIHSLAPLIYFQGSHIDQELAELREEGDVVETNAINLIEDAAYRRKDSLELSRASPSAVSTPISVKRNISNTRPSLLVKSPRNEPRPKSYRRLGAKELDEVLVEGIAHSWRPPTTNWMKME